MRSDDWSALPPVKKRKANANSDPANGGVRREPEIPVHVDVAPKAKNRSAEFDFSDTGAASDGATQAERARINMARNARQAALDPGDGIAL